MGWENAIKIVTQAINGREHPIKIRQKEIEGLETGYKRKITGSSLSGDI